MSDEALHALLRYRDGRSTLIEIGRVYDALDVPDDAFPPDFAIGCDVEDEPLDGSIRFERASEPMHHKVMFDQKRVD